MRNTKHTGMNMSLIKKQNRSSILNYICEVGPVSRKDISDATGLTPASVTQITNQLMDEGILEEIGTNSESNKAGRKKVLCDIKYDSEYLFAINIEAEITTIALSDLKGNCIEKINIQTDNRIGAEDFLKKIAVLVDKIRESQKKIKRCNIKVISVGICGLVDREEGISVHAYGVWDDPVNVCEILENETGYKTYIDNNVDAFAKAEILYGMGRKRDDFLLIKWGPGVGATIVIGREVYAGRHGKSAELGHFIVEQNGKVCSCGRRGCLETKVSYHAMQEIKPFQVGAFGDCVRNASGREKELFDEVLDLFARTIVNSATILAPEKIVLSGKLFSDSDIRKKVIDFCMSYDKKIDVNRVLYTSLSEMEDYIGPVASYVSEVIF
ncbi:MAG: ROK family transcriptional regulator [Lachnospiraceae bacterium]|nr:ROK family transcriptional regulator [Lachnospiraceae bacterium]